MIKPPARFKLKPSVMAVSAIIGVLSSNHVVAQSTIVSGSISGFSNYSSYDLVSITNTGNISGNAYGINNQGSISTLTNNGTISATYYGLYGYYGSIGTLTNFASLSGGEIGIYNDSGNTITSLTNSGTLSGGETAVYNNSGNIGTLTNSGIISAGNAGIHNNSGTIGSLTNSGLILGYVGIDNAYGTIGTLANTGSIKGHSYAINNDGGTLGTIANSGTILGNIYSTSGLTITGGAGTTVGALSGYTTNNNLTGSVGSINLTSGDLVLSGGNQILNDNVTLSSGSLNNSGSTLYVANVITINGNYNQSASASLNNYVFSDSVYGQLQVNGAANIASGSSVNLIGYQYGFATGQRYVVVSADSGNYNESALHYSATGYTGSIVGSSVSNSGKSDLVLTLVGTPTTGGDPSGGDNSGSGTTPVDNTSGGDTSQVVPPVVKTARASTPNALASLGGLQRYSGISDAALLNLYNASLAISSTSEGNKAGEQLSPHQNASAGFATSASTFDMINVIGNHIGAVDAIKVARNGSSSGISAGDVGVDQAGWGQIFGGSARQDMTDDISGYRANYGGAVIGYDYAVTDDWRLGGAVSYTRTNVDGKDNVQGSSSNVNSYGLTAYASYVAPTWYSNLYAAALEQRYNTQRQVSFTGYDGVANGNFNGQQYAFKAEFGYPIALSSNVTLTPLANVNYSYLSQDSYTESGGNGAALKVDSAHIDAIRSGLGAKLETTLETPLGDVVPYVQALWNHQYNNDRMDISSAYAADTAETSFVARGSSPVRNAADFTVGATLISSKNTSLTAYYDLGTASNYTNQSVSLRIKQSF